MPKGNDQAPSSALALSPNGAGVRVRVAPMRRVGAGLAAFVAVAGYAFVVANGVFRCPLAAMFHVPCPTCGSTRSTLALLEGDVNGALLNPVAPALLVCVGAFASRLVYVAARDGHVRAFDDHPAMRLLLRAFLGTLLVAILIWIVRFFGLLGGPVPV